MVNVIAFFLVGLVTTIMVGAKTGLAQGTLVLVSYVFGGLVTAAIMYNKR